MTSCGRPCPACGSSSSRDVRRFDEVGLLSCSECRLVYTARRPSDHELGAWYSSYPIADHISPITVDRLDEIVSSFEPYRRLGTLIDVGAGSGHLAQAAQRRGWTVHAVEYGPRQRDRLAAQGVLTHQPLLEGPRLEAGPFDVVVLQEVIEHMRDPARELHEVARILRPSGLLYVTCPNFASLSCRMLGPRWRVVEYPEHLNYFTPATLRSCLARHGLHEVSVGTTGLSIDDLRAVVPRRRCTPDHRSESVDERVRGATGRYRSLAALKRATNEILTRFQLGDTIKGRYEPPPT
jgi:2-polyprenyl-3-methyl-5-hydroxy-6-metoxy-1,4-benzoquinol methylase